MASSIVTAALLERDQPRQEIWTVQRCIAEYLRQIEYRNVSPVFSTNVPDAEMEAVIAGFVIGPKLHGLEKACR